MGQHSLFWFCLFYEGDVDVSKPISTSVDKTVVLKVLKSQSFEPTVTNQYARLILALA